MPQLIAALKENDLLSKLRTAVLFVAIIFVLFRGLGTAGIGSGGLLEPDEGRYAEIPRRMVESGDYVTPRLNGLKYFEKPPLVYWANAASFLVFGENSFAARVPVASFALLGIGACWFIARRMYGHATADWSAVVLASSLLYHSVGRLNILDGPLAALMTVTMASAWSVAEKGGGKGALSLFYLSCALGLLTKGLIALVLPGGALLFYALATRNPRLLWTIASFLPGILLFFAVSAPWFILVSIRNPEFPYFFFIHEHFLRYMTKIHDRYEPFWFFLPIIMAGLIPWLGFLPGALRDALTRARAALTERRHSSPEIFLLCWFLFILLFFSASDSKLIPYVTPCMPPLAILIGNAIYTRVSAADRKPGAAVALVTNALILLALAVALINLPRFFKDPRYDLSFAYLAAKLMAAALFFLIITSLTGFKRSLRETFSIIVPLATIFFVFMIQTVPRIVATGKSVQNACWELRKQLGPDDIIINYRDFIQGAQFYLGRRILLVEYEGELAFGRQMEPQLAQDYFMSDEEFHAFLQQPTKGERFLIFENDDYKNIPSYVGHGATVVEASHNFTVARLRRR